MVPPEPFSQSTPPPTSLALFGGAGRPPTPHALNTGTLAAATPARPIAAILFRRDNCGQVKRSRLMSCGPYIAGVVDQAGINETLTDSVPLATRSRPFWNSVSGN